MKALDGNNLQNIMSKLTDIITEEQDAYDNMPESLQESERGEAMSEAIDHLEAAFDAIETACDAIDEAVDELYEAIQ